MEPYQQFDRPSKDGCWKRLQQSLGSIFLWFHWFSISGIHQWSLSVELLAPSGTDSKHRFYYTFLMFLFIFVLIYSWSVSSMSISRLLCNHSEDILYGRSVVNVTIWNIFSCGYRFLQRMECFVFLLHIQGVNQVIRTFNIGQWRIERFIYRLNSWLIQSSSILFTICLCGTIMSITLLFIMFRSMIWHLD